MNKTFPILVAGEINPDLSLSGNSTPEFGQMEKLVDSAALMVGSCQPFLPAVWLEWGCR